MHTGEDSMMYIGYIVIGIVAFLLGVALTRFTFHLKKTRRERDVKDEDL